MSIQHLEQLVSLLTALENSNHYLTRVQDNETHDATALDSLIAEGVRALETTKTEILRTLRLISETEAPLYLTALPWTDGPKGIFGKQRYWREWAHNTDSYLLFVEGRTSQWFWQVARVEGEEWTYYSGYAESAEEAKAAADASWERYLAEIAAA